MAVEHDSIARRAPLLNPRLNPAALAYFFSNLLHGSPPSHAAPALGVIPQYQIR